MAVSGIAAMTELWAKVKDGFGRKLNLVKAATTIDIQLRNNAGTNLDSVTIAAATSEAAGLMTAADRSKLDGIAEGANAVTIDAALSATSTNPVQNKAVQAAVAAKADTASPALTGTPTAPTASAGTSTTQIATTAFVATACANVATGATHFRGTASSSSAIEGASYKAGWYWVVSTAGTYVGQECEAGDMVFAVSDKGTAYADSDFSVVQNNLVEMTAAEVDAICTF